MRAIETIKNIWKIEDLRKRIITTILLVLVYRVGSYVVLPGIDPANLDALRSQTSKGLMQLLDMFSGGAFSNASIFALGIMPYITASIVIQLLGMVMPSFQKLQREGESGRTKLNQYTRYLTVIILLMQGPAYLVNLKVQMGSALFPSGWLFIVSSTIVLAAGSMFIMWLGERITDKGIGNGISFIILVGIIARLPLAFAAEFTSRLASKQGGLVMFLIEIIFLLAVIAAAILLVQGTRKVPVQYAKRIVGNKQYGGARQYIPLKVNTSGVIPVIFAQSLLQFPIIISSFAGYSGTGVWSEILKYLNSGYWCKPSQIKYSIGLLVYIALIIFFAYFYTSITFNPLMIADNMKKQGGFIPGIRPGKPTSDYLNKVLNYIVLIGAIGLTIIAVLPYIFSGVFNASVSFGGTSLIIIVSVVLETMKQVESQMLVRNYKGFLEK